MLSRRDVLKAGLAAPLIGHEEQTTHGWCVGPDTEYRKCGGCGHEFGSPWFYFNGKPWCQPCIYKCLDAVWMRYGDDQPVAKLIMEQQWKRPSR